MDILQYTPKEALKRQYTQEVGADMLDNMDMEMEMAMKASTGNEEIIADIRKVQEYIGSVHERETELSKVLSGDGISEVVQAAEYSGAVIDRIVGVSVGVEAKRQRQGTKGHDPSVLGKLMCSETKHGKVLEAGQKIEITRNEAIRKKRKKLEMRPNLQSRK